MMNPARLTINAKADMGSKKGAVTSSKPAATVGVPDTVRNKPVMEIVKNVLVMEAVKNEQATVVVKKPPLMEEAAAATENRDKATVVARKTTAEKCPVGLEKSKKDLLMVAVEAMVGRRERKGIVDGRNMVIGMSISKSRAMLVGEGTARRGRERKGMVVVGDMVVGSISSEGVMVMIIRAHKTTTALSVMSVHIWLAGNTKARSEVCWMVTSLITSK